MLAVGLAGVTPAQAAAGEGSAYGLKADGPLLTIAPLAMSQTGGPETNSLISPALPAGIAVGTLETSARHDPGTGGVASQATASDVMITNDGLGGQGASVGIEAARAQCSSTQEGISGSTTLSGLQLPGGQSIPADAVNYSFDVGRGRMTVNEQIHNPDGGLTVNAAHLTIPGLTAELDLDIVIASATCGPATTP
ncbi:choice-of-anchor P family protein [Streptomyces sp. NPDC051364]|uniref:choice-of-anchor P family protein n=1 Tax=Streptomyces sp. NPDC051364 TaxID=3155799 RepID=UPI00342DD898